VRDEEASGFDWSVVPAIVGEVNAGDPATWRSLASIRCPTLLIAGGAASHIPQDKLAEVAALIPRCTLVTIPAGHHVHRDEPARFLQAVLGWMDADTFSSGIVHRS